MTSTNRKAASPSRPSRLERLFRLPLTGRRSSKAAELAVTAGRLPEAWLETLENRVLLAGDHPSLANFPSATSITINASGNGSLTGNVETAGSDDLLKFVAPVNGFVKVAAAADRTDPFNVLDSRIEIYSGTTTPTLIYNGSSYFERPDGNTLVGDRVNTDGIVGFTATQGTTYYVRVLSDRSSGSGSTGKYSVVITAKDADPEGITSVALNGTTGLGSQAGTLIASDYDVFQFTAPGADFVSVRGDTLNSVGSTLDSSVEIYDSVSGALVAAGAGNGSLTGGNPTDGWAGFVATAGASYYVRVLATPSLAAGKTATGAYTLRIDGITTNIANPAVATAGTIGSGGAVLGDEIIYKFTSPGAASSNSIFLANATTSAGLTTDIDTRLEVYDDAGNTLTSDSESGWRSNAFGAWKGDPSKVYYVRVRSDRFVDPTPANGTDAQAYWGSYSLVLTTSSVSLAVDPVTRRVASGGFGGKTTTVLYTFTAQGSGETIISMAGAGLPPLADTALHLYSATGSEIAFNDDYTGQNGPSNLNVTLVGGQQYWILSEGFDDNNAGGFSLNVESNHTYVAGGIDDHANANQWLDATPVIFNYNTALGTNYLTGGTLADHERVIRGTANGRIHRAGDTDLFTFTPPIDMLSDFAGKDDQAAPPALKNWLPFHRPGSKVSFYIRNEEGFLGQVNVTVFDSNFNQVFATNQAWTGTPPYPESAVAAAIDPSAYPPEFNSLINYPFIPANQSNQSFQVWGGEQYYMQIQGGFEGRYSLVMFVNGVPFPAGDANFDGVPDPADPNQYLVNYDVSGAAGASFITDIAGAGQYGSARELGFGSGGWTTNAWNAIGLFGLGTPYQRLWLTPGAGNGPPGFNPLNAGTGLYRLEEGGLAGIEHPLDTDMYKFRAPYTGFAEIRLNTTGLNDWNNEFIADGEPPATQPTTILNAQKTKTYNSPLDGALRIFSGDQQEIGYNNDNPAISGETGQYTVGNANDGTTSINYTFHKRDARVVVPIVAGQVYYVQVESGQRAAYQNYTASAANINQPVDWTHIIGSYELIIHTLGNISQPSATDSDDFPDDIDGQRVFGTTLPIDLSLNNDGTPTTANGTAAISGVINNYVNNTTDTDIFQFISPSRGNMIVRLARTVGSNLSGVVAIYNNAGTQINFGAADLSGNVTVSFPVTPGDRFYISVGGGGSSEGGYNLTLTGPKWSDDAADETQFQNAKQISLLDFQGVGSVAGNLEAPGDSDVFYFIAPANTTMNITVTSSAASMDPTVTVYELNLDGRVADVGTAGYALTNAVPLRIAFNDNADGTTLNSAASFSVSNTRTSPAPNNGTGLTYNVFYVVVRGADRNVNYGAYTVALSFPPTDDYADAGDYQNAGSLALDNSTGLGQIDGITESVTDSDIFIFTAPAGGSTTVTVDRRPGTTSGIIPKLSVIKLVNNVPVVVGTNTAGTGPFTPATLTFAADRGVSYFVVVENTGGVFGAYRVDVAATPIDDHANSGEFPIATVIPLSSTDGNGAVGSVAGASDTPRLSYAGDTDLFTFVTRNAGVSTITITVLQGNLAPGLTIYDSTGFQIGTASAGSIGQTVTFTTASVANNTRFYILASAVALGGASLTGQYKLAVDGPNPPDGGGGGDPGSIDFNNPVVIPLDSLTGYGESTAQIDLAGDRDLFTFTTFASPGSVPRNIQVQIITPTGSTLDASITILNAANESAIETQDSGGYPGVEANVNFDDVGPNQYYIIVEGAGNGVGTYTVRVLAEPQKHTVFFPEGYSSASINEFISIGNPSTTTTAAYSVILRYETGEIGGVVSSGTIAPGSRGGVTLSNGANGVLAGVRPNTPYSIVIESNIEVAATLAHYDFGTSIGDAFTSESSDTWTFSRLERVPGSVFDFVVYYNPNNFDVEVTLTAYAAGQSPVSLTQTVGANRRLGFSINDIPQFPTGVFGGILTSKAKSSANQAAFRGVVASLSHYNQTFGTGFAELGDPGLGDTNGAINSLTNGANVSGELVLFNPGTAPAVVNLTGTYIRTPALPQVVRTINLAAKQVLVLSGSQLNLVADQPIGFAFNANVPVSLLASETQADDANATSTFFRAGTGFVFGDAFINTAAAGQLYFETLNFHNPTSTDSTVLINLLFSNSDVVTVSVQIAARGFAELKLHELPQIINDRPGLNFFSIQVTGALPFTASLTHYDLYLGGGWTTSGAVYGLTNPISRIS